MTLDGLPRRWRWQTLDQLLMPLPNRRLLQQGKSPQCHAEPSPSDEAWGVLKTTAIQAGRFLPEYNKRLPDHLPPDPGIEVEVGDLLITSAGPRARCGVPALVRSTRPRLMLSGKIYRFRPDPTAMDARYLELFLLSAGAQADIENMKTGISDSGLNLTQDRFLGLSVPVPPIEEQRRIVGILEDHLSRLDAAASYINGVPEACQALYSAGLMSLGGVVAQQGSICSIGQAARAIRGVTYRKAEAQSDEQPDTVRLLRATNFSDGRLIGTGCLYVPRRRVSPEQRLQAGDVLIASSSGSSAVVGKSVIISDQVRNTTFGAFCAVLRPNPRADPWYLYYWINRPDVRRQWSRLAAGTNINNLKLSDVLATEIRLPSLAEQREEGQRLFTADWELSRLRAQVETALARGTALRRSLLGAAFSGRLTSARLADEGEVAGV